MRFIHPAEGFSLTKAELAEVLYQAARPLGFVVVPHYCAKALYHVETEPPFPLWDLDFGWREPTVAEEAQAVVWLATHAPDELETVPRILLAPILEAAGLDPDRIRHYRLLID